MKKLSGIIVLLLAGAALYLALKTSPIDPLAWDAPAAPQMTGVLEPNDTLMKAELLGQGQLHGPEDTAVDSQGRVYAGLADGRVVRLDASGKVETFVDTGGRPLGMDFDAAGNLILADAWKGLLRIDPQGKVETLATEADGVPFAFTDDLDIASDGRIYFSDASSKFHQPDYILDLLEARPHGRLLRYDPSTGKTEVLLKDLYFANGVALSANEDFVLVNETYRYRITRYWLKGERLASTRCSSTTCRACRTTSRATAGYLLGGPADPAQGRRRLPPPASLAEGAAGQAAAHVPAQPTAYGLVIAIDEQGRIVRSLHDTSGHHLRMITSAKPVGDQLYFGSLENDRIGRLAIP